ncbi:DUF2256 domain-containing protein [Caenispirillum salinarum]|uniref:DUF2256 domain-containing protein n=1 Tax=Caenispirillum salinarum TaxID=859058 RepID=UPI003850FA53
MAHRKPHLPTKTCEGCGRPFSWRRKWALVWSEVKWCSDRCRRSKARAPGTTAGGRHSPSAPAAVVRG